MQILILSGFKVQKIFWQLIKASFILIQFLQNSLDSQKHRDENDFHVCFYLT